MTKPTYGFVFNRQSTETLPAVTTDMSSVFLVGVSEDATAMYPIGVTVPINSGDQASLAGLGTGDLAVAVRLINAQLGPFQVAARIAVHRVAKGASDAETIANLLGSQAAGTGLYAALRVGAIHGFTPRLLMIAGGYTGKNITRAPNGTVVVQAPKFGGNVGAGLMTLASPAYGASGTAKPGIYKVRLKTVAANGGVFSVVDPDGNVLADATVGTAYAGAFIKFTIADGATDFALGDGFDVTVAVTTGAMNASSLVASLPQIENALGAHSVVDGPNTTYQDALDFRETIASDHTIMVDFAVTPAGMAPGVFVAGAAAAVGVGIAVDFSNDGVPSQSWANQPIQGITALKRYDSFSLNDGATEGQELIAAGIGVCERGNAGDPSAVADSGFVLVAAFNCSPDPEWQFFNVTRLRDYIHLIAQKRWRARIGKNNITVHAVQAVENDLVQELGTLKADEHIIDFRVGVDKKSNTPATIRAGGIRVFFKAEEASPLLLVEADSYRYPEALDGLIVAVSGETDQLISAN